MKNIFLVFVLMMVCTHYSLGQAAPKDSQDAVTESIIHIKDASWLTLSGSAQKTIVQNYIDALDSFTLAMPIVVGDIEATWAADTVHTIAQRVRKEQHSSVENMADICRKPSVNPVLSS